VTMLIHNAGGAPKQCGGQNGIADRAIKERSTHRREKYQCRETGFRGNKVKGVIHLKKLENELTWKDLEIGCIVTERAAPGNTAPVTGGHSGRPTTSANALNAACARFIVRKDASAERRAISIQSVLVQRVRHLQQRMLTKYSMVNRSIREKGSIEVSCDCRSR